MLRSCSAFEKTGFIICRTTILSRSYVSSPARRKRKGRTTIKVIRPFLSSRGRTRPPGYEAGPEQFPASFFVCKYIPQNVLVQRGCILAYLQNV
jgi:hypothetical protein